MLFKVLGMTSLLSLPLGIVSHPLGGNVGLHAISGTGILFVFLYLGFCICLIVFHILLVVVCVCMPSDGIGRTFIDRAAEEIDSRLDGDGHQTVDCHHRPRQDHRLDRDGHQSYRRRWQQNSNEVQSIKHWNEILQDDSKSSRTGPEESVGQNLQKPGCQCQQKCWNVMFKVVEDLPIPSTALRNRSPKPFHWSVCLFVLL